MTLAAASPAAARLQRLAGYLEQDPTNAQLLADACETAIACGQHAQAETFIASAERLQLDPAQWLFRRARVAIARRELPAAAQFLERVRALAGDHPAIAHDLAYVRLLQDDPEACRSAVQPWLQAPVPLPGEQMEALQLLWLRAMHRLDHVEEALAWARAQAAAGTLHARAAGAASLVALDDEDLAAAREWADAALAADARQPEALVARGCVAMAAGDVAGAQPLLQRALESNPEDGRAWSALGMASLQAQDFPQAQAQLEQAVRTLPGHVGTWHALGWTHLLQGQREPALAVFREALALDPDFAESHGAFALVLALSGQRADAQQHLEIADRLDPRNMTGRYARALLAGEGGDGQALAAVARQLLAQADFFGAAARGAPTCSAGTARPPRTGRS